MLRTLRPRSIYDVMAAIACFAVLAGGTAYAANTIATGDIIDNQVTSPDVRDDNLGFGGLAAQDLGPNSVGSSEIASGAVGSSEVQDNSLTGADVNEGSLATVPSAVLGGLGRTGLRQNGTTGPGSCDPESTTFINCDIAAGLTLSSPARILVIGSVRALTDVTSTDGRGQCQLGTTSGTIPGTTFTVAVHDTPAGDRGTENLTISGVTGVFPAGSHSFGIDCNDEGGIQYPEAGVTAVALSDR